MIELQVQLENVDHLRAKDTSLCRRLDLLRQLNGIQPPLPGDPIHLGQRCIEGQMGIEAGGGAGQQGGDLCFRLRPGRRCGKLGPQAPLPMVVKSLAEGREWK